ncbi:MAG: hypothetical protein KBD53_11615 [Candidatus Omnitrophica bacterium]|nr:hypothetical protein [Candidatus Omnitrophota bacterium]
MSEILSLTIDLDSIKALTEKDLENQARQLLSQPINDVIIELKEDFLQRQRHFSS